MPPKRGALVFKERSGAGNGTMHSYDRDTELERRQIHEISANVARRLLDVLERRHTASPAAAADIASGARVVADIQREIDGIMNRLPPGAPLEMAVLTHVLESHNKALSLVEDLEARLSGSVSVRRDRPDPERTHAALIATAREIEREARLYEEEEARQMTAARPLPSSAPFRTGPAMPTSATSNSAMSNVPPTVAVPSHPTRTVRTGTGTVRRTPRPSPPPAARMPEETRRSSLLSRLRALAASPIGATAAVACVAILAASFAGALSFALSSAENDERIAAHGDPDRKFDGRLSQADAIPTRGSGTLVVSPPENAVNLAQPYLVVIATRPSTEELEQDFRYFKETYPTLLGNARGRVDSVQSQDGKTWHRLSLVPPRAQTEAAELCHELKTAGLTECWIKPLPIPLSSAQAR